MHAKTEKDNVINYSSSFCFLQQINKTLDKRATCQITPDEIRYKSIGSLTGNVFIGLVASVLYWIVSVDGFMPKEIASHSSLIRKSLVNCKNNYNHNQICDTMRLIYLSIDLMSQFNAWDSSQVLIIELVGLEKLWLEINIEYVYEWITIIALTTIYAIICFDELESTFEKNLKMQFLTFLNDALQVIEFAFRLHFRLDFFLLIYFTGELMFEFLLEANNYDQFKTAPHLANIASY